MHKKYFEFEVYRINLVQSEPMLFSEMDKPIRDDKDIVAILKHAIGPAFKVAFSAAKNTYEWAVRDFCQYYHTREDENKIYGLTLARSIVESAGEIVTDTGIEEGVSSSSPPLAETCRLFFYLSRHLLIIERLSVIINSRWKKTLDEIIKMAAMDLSYTGSLEFEPVPRHEEVIEAFRSFDRLTRLCVKLRLPNPELSRFSKKLYDEMVDSSIREYLQDMRNPYGLDKGDGKLPRAAVEMAAAGYKDGEVTLEGIRKNKLDKVKTGSAAAHGRVSALREYVRGMQDNSKTKEAKQVTSSILDEIDRIVPPPSEQGNK